MINFKCRKCGAEMESLARKVERCPQCKVLNRVPWPPGTMNDPPRIEFNCGQCGVEMEAPQSQAGELETCPKCKEINRVPLLQPAPGPINVRGNESRTNSVNQDPGFVYVLVNSAMPGLIKVGKTKRDPEARAQQLSGVTGIPTPFVVAYHEWFSDCSSAEDYVHTFLEANGYRVADNREFFSAPVKAAIQGIMQAKAQQPQSNGEASGKPGSPMSNVAGNDGVSPEPWSDLLEQAKAAHHGFDDAVEDHQEAARLYKQAARLGSGAACLAMGNLCRSEEFGSDDRAAIKWFNEGVPKGAVDGYAELALLYLERKQGENAAKCFAKYSGLLDGQPVTDGFLWNCFRFLQTAARHGMVFESLGEIEPYRDQIVQSENAVIATLEAEGIPVPSIMRTDLLRVRYMLYGNVPDQRYLGKIKFWFPENNHGLITGAGGEDVYLLGYQIVEGKLPPYEGQPVSFVPVVTPEGLEACVVILMLSEETPAPVRRRYLANDA